MQKEQYNTMEHKIYLKIFLFAYPITTISFRKYFGTMTLNIYAWT